MATKKVTTTVYITEEQNQFLKELNRRTKVPVAEYVREGIDLVLKKYKQHLPGQLDLLSESGREISPEVGHSFVTDSNPAK